MKLFRRGVDFRRKEKEGKNNNGKIIIATRLTLTLTNNNE